LHVVLRLMSTKLRFIGCVLFVLPVTLGAVWAVVDASFAGIVEDPKGNGMQGVELRVKARDGTVISRTLTDAKGHYVTAKIPSGIYNVDLVFGSVIKGSLNQKALAGGNATTLNFALTNRGLDPSKKAKHFVWVPPQTGSHLAGRWVEDDGSATATMEHIQKADGRLMQRLQQNGGIGSGMQP
jgi:Carboxypeptidase regulatory-like domain